MNNNINLTLKISALLFFLIFSFMMIHIIYFSADSNIEHFDIATLKFAGQIRNGFLTNIFKGITIFGSTAFLVIASIVLLLIAKLRKNYGFAVVLPLATASFFNTTFKLLVYRSRPDVIPHLVIENSMSFPSGHTTCSIVFYLLLSYYTYQLIQKQKNRTSQISLKVLCSLFIILPFMIATSRIYLGVHYPSDVIGGIFLGLFFVFAAISLTPLLKPTSKKL